MQVCGNISSDHQHIWLLPCATEFQIFFTSQGDVEDLSVEEHEIDGKIRFFLIFFIPITELSCSEVFHLISLTFVLHFREMKEKLRDLSEDDYNKK